MAFHHQPDQAFTLGRGLGQKLLGGGLDRSVVGADLDLRHGLHRNGDALLGVEVLLRGYVKAHQFQRQHPEVLDHGPDDSAAAFDDLHVAEAVNQQRFVRSYLAIESCQAGNAEHQHQHNCAHKNP